MNKKIVFAMHDAGIATAVVSALPLMSSKFDLTILAGRRFAYPKLLESLNSRNKLPFRLNNVDRFPLEQARNYLESEKPDAVITAISNIYKDPDKVDYTLPETAADLQIPVIGVFEPVFLSAGLIEPRLNRQRRLPDKLIVASELMKKTLTCLNLFRPQDVITSPMPKYSEYVTVRRSPDLPEVKQTLHRLNNLDDNDFALVYSSSAHPADKLVVEMIAESVAQTGAKVLLTFHPKDSPEFRNWCRNIIPGSRFLDFASLPQLKALTALSLGNNGAFCSLKTSLMFDVAASGGKTVSITPPPLTACEDAGSLLGITRNVGTVSALTETIFDIRHGNFCLPETFPEHPDAPEEFIRTIEKLIN